jgi:hypothetical protein
VLGNQFHGGAIVVRASLDEIPHGIDKQTLAFNIARIGGAVTIQMLCAGAGRNE